MPVTSQVARFGIFELDLNTGELCKNGRKLKLQEQPFRILILLLEQPGQTVTRDRLTESLWPSDTFVDFDHSLNAAIAKLRQALGDSAENPRFVETLARRGYRFIAPVEVASNGNSNLTPVPAPESVVAAALAQEIPVSPPVNAKIRIGWVLAIGFVGLAIVAAFAIWFSRKPAPGQAELVQLTNDIGLTTDPAVSPDGKLLAYASDRADGRNLNIWIQQLSEGGSAVQLTHFDADTSEPSFSPDGNKIVFHSGQNGGGVYVIPTVGGEPVRLAPIGRDPRFSPDGQWIAYWRGAYGSPPVTGIGGGNIFVVPAAGGPERRIGSDLKGFSPGALPIWAPDSKRVLVSDSSGDSIDWWMIHLDKRPSRRTNISGTLKQQGFRFAYDRIPHVSEWRPGFILFSAPYGDTYNAWRLPLSDEGRSTGPAERLTSGTTLEVSPVLTASGSLIFASLNLVHSVWGIAAETNRGVISGDLKRITDGRFEFMPSISRDGRRLAFAAAKRGATTPSPVQDDDAFMLPFPRHSSALEIRVKDLETGTEAAISAGEPLPMGPELSSDGSMVAYTARGKVYVSQVDHPAPHMVIGARKAWGWSPDDERLFFRKLDNQTSKISVLDVASGHQSLFLSKPDYNLFQARYSPDGRAVAVNACAEKTGCWVFIVPLNSEGIPQTDDWIAIDHPSLWDDKPRWSPNGNLLYFISDRDGHLCLWAQRFDRSTKRKVGAPFPVYHFHNSRLAMINVGTGALEIDVAREKIVMGLGELTGNIWSVKR